MSRTIPNCNRSFIIESLLINKRIDGRSLHQFRNLKVNYGQTFGSVYVQMGHTVVFASTEAVVDEPRLTRPAEGRFKMVMNISAGGKDKWLKNMERSQPNEGVLTMRLLEKIINRINVVDLESLCLVTGRAVWCITTKLVLLNYDGNLIEAASIATIASLMHFRRPDATVTADGDIVVHSLEERPPIPLTLFHYPICVTFQFMDHTLLKRIISENQAFNSAQHQQRVCKAMNLMICDPTEEEEDFLNNVLVVCANTYQEIVSIQSLGRISLNTFSKKLLHSCTTKAFSRVKFVTDYLKAELEKHKQDPSIVNSRQPRNGFHQALASGELCIVRDYRQNPIFSQCNSFTLPPADEDVEVKESEDSVTEEQVSIFLRSQRNIVNEVGQGGPSQWGIDIGLHSEFDDQQQQEDEQCDNADDMPPISGAWKAKKHAKPQTTKQTSSYAKVLVPKGNNANRPHQATANPTPKVKSSTPSVPPPQVNPVVKNVPKKPANDWIKVSGKKCINQQQEQQKLTTSQKRRKAKKARKQANQQQFNAKNSTSEDDNDDEQVTTLKSEFAE